MGQVTTLTCRCGSVALTLTGPSIASVECLCNSCRTAGPLLASLPDASPVLDDKGATPFVMQRKDRMQIAKGRDLLANVRLSGDAKTRRVVATCCNTPLFLELPAGHWASVYGTLWPADTRPAPQMRTMTGDLADDSTLPDDIPNLKSHSFGFFAKLLGAWVKMGFRNPKIVVERDLDITAIPQRESAK